MAIPNLLDVLGSGQTDKYPAEGLVDRINFGATIYLLVFFLTVTGSAQQFGSAIECLFAPEFTDGWNQFYTEYCYINDKYYISNVTERASNPNDQIMYPYLYYQWIPYFIMLEIFIFLLPKMLWKMVANQIGNGREMQTALIEAGQLRNQMGSDREKSTAALADFTLDFLHSSKMRLGACLGGRLAWVCYCLMKWLCVANAVFQFYLLSFFTDRSHSVRRSVHWVIETVSDFSLMVMSRSHEKPRVPEEGPFPRVVSCWVPQHDQVSGHENQRWMQCLLMGNMLNEKVFMVLWLWMVMLAAVSLVSALRHTFLLLPPVRMLAAESHLPTYEVLFRTESNGGAAPSVTASRQLIYFFVHKVLRTDGVLLLMFVHNHAGSLVAHDLAHAMWRATVQQRMEKSPLERMCSEDEETAAALKKLGPATPQLVHDKQALYPNPHAHGDAAVPNAPSYASSDDDPFGTIPAHRAPEGPRRPVAFFDKSESIV